MKRLVGERIERWRREPAAMRLRIATLLTAGCGVVLVVLWLFILLPLQLRLTRPSGSETVSSQVPGTVSGVRDEEAALPSATPTPDVQYFHDTRPSRQEATE